MKKSIINIKDIIQYKVRGDKSDNCIFPYMNDEEKHIENIKQTLITAEKKVSNSLICPHESTKSSDKKSKKYPPFVIGAAFEGSCKSLKESNPDSVLSTVLGECSEYCKDLSETLGEYEENVEKSFLSEIRKYSSENLHTLNKHKAQVTKEYNQLKNLKNKLKSLENSSLGSSAMNEAKLDNLKIELEECEVKHQKSRDVYEIAMMEFSCEEVKIAQLFSNYVHIQKIYFQQMQQKLQEFLPKLDSVISGTSQMPVFKVDLSQHLEITKQPISLVLDFGIRILINAKNEEGLFRLSGSASKVKLLRYALDCGKHKEVMKNHNLEFHVVAGVIKNYLRELPEPLLTKKLSSEWLRVVALPEQERFQQMQTVVNKMPKDYKANLCFLIKFFHELTKNNEINKMTSQNLAIAVGPSLFWTTDENENINMTNVSPVIVEALITHCDEFFPEGQEPSLFYEDMKKESLMDSSNEIETISKFQNFTINTDNECQNTSKAILNYRNSIRCKRNNSPTKDFNPNLSPTATIRSTVHPSPRLGREAGSRPKSFYERPSVTPPCIPSRAAPEIKDNNLHRFSYHPNIEPEMFGSSIYPSLAGELLDISQNSNSIPIYPRSPNQPNGQPATNLSTPQKPPRSNATGKSPIPDSTQL